MNALTDSEIKRINTILNKAPASKPVESKKIIDLTKMVGSDIDMSFYHDFNTTCVPRTSKLKEMRENGYVTEECVKYNHCRIRQNHIHFYNGIGNPLPDGLLVTLYFNNNNKSAGGTLTLKQGMYFNTYPSSEHQLRAEISFKSQDIDWDRLYDVSGFEVIDTLPEYKYGWEKEE